MWAKAFGSVGPGSKAGTVLPGCRYGLFLHPGDVHPSTLVLSLQARWAGNNSFPISAAEFLKGAEGLCVSFHTAAFLMGS